MLGMHLLLAFALAAFSNALTPMGVVVSTILIYLVLKMGAGLMGVRGYVRRLELGVGFVFWFGWEIIRASLDVARVVFGLNRSPNPAIVAIRLQRQDDRYATLVGALLTLTPGTMALEYDSDTGLMYVHALDATTVETVETGIREIEMRLLAWSDASDSPETAEEKFHDR